jgi:ribosomal protein L31E
MNCGESTMKLTLRKAHRVVKDLTQKSGLRFEQKDVHHSASATEVQEAIQAVNSTNFKAVETALNVHEAINTIRAALQKANSTEVDGNSVDALLSRKVLIEGQMKVLASFREKAKTTDAEILAKTLREVQDNHESTSEYRSTYTRVGGISAVWTDHLNTLFVQHKQEQESVSDKLAYINNKLEIEIDDKYVELLKELQVL